MLEFTPGNGTVRNFVVFSYPRCGSTTLQQLLNCHPEIRCLEEPFNPFNYGGWYLQQVQRSGTLDETLQTIWSSYNGIKHTWCPNGWPFGNRDLNVRLLLKRNQRVVLLRRRNVLRRLVSNHISTQSNIWGLFNEEERDRLRTLRFAPMDLAETRVRIQNERDTELEYRSLLMESGISFLEIWYEDFYGPERSVHNRMGSLNEIFRFLGTSAIPASRLTPELARLFDHATMKLNSAATYRQIPGIEEVERVCGSDVTGWVFKE